MEPNATTSSNNDTHIHHNHHHLNPHNHHHHAILPSTSILIIVLPIIILILLFSIIFISLKLKRLKLEQDSSASSKNTSAVSSADCMFTTTHCSTFDINFSPDTKNRCIYGSSSVSSKDPKVKLRGVQVFTYKELEYATDRFSQSNVIGTGGFGVVYRGVLRDGNVAAVKRLRVDGKQGERAFRIEVDDVNTTFDHLDGLEDLSSFIEFAERVEEEFYKRECEPESDEDVYYATPIIVDFPNVRG